ncbi:hypothetical protein BV210_11280 [Halorientalis sp. IM1011]|uniref:hypothetical protein n=1 Tax=Halorientalis sp. IM1011 TaxID=1932360 RepID=UPI00097CC3FE|nr:hypothetical protein [Halorientalis sp. IM1011]AQL43265.1 hypothetical protein BV210_11280 [Halorientalis sp. IM1011]
MPASDPDLATAAASFHEEIPHRFQVSLTMSMQTRDSLRAVRDAVNEASDERVFTNDDVIRAALQAAASYHATETDEGSETGDRDAAQLRPIAAVIADVLEPDEGT